MLVGLDIFMANVQFLISCHWHQKHATLPLSTPNLLCHAFWQQQMYAFAQLAERFWFDLRSLSAAARVQFCIQRTLYASAQWLLRWKRRRAARKFESTCAPRAGGSASMGHGRQIDKDSDDKSRWN